MYRVAWSSVVWWYSRKAKKGLGILEGWGIKSVES